jgi:glycosyltransferase involved in cell wall biosynthesis
MGTDSTLPGLSVVLVHSGRGRATDAIVAAATAAASVSSDFEIVVVENGMGEHTASSAALLRDPRLHVRLLVHPHSRGGGAALRSGLEAARMPWVLVLDDAQAIEPGALGELAAATTSADVVVGRREPARPARVWHRLLRRPAGDAVVLVRRDLLERSALRAGDKVIAAQVLVRCREAGARVAERALQP